MKRLIPALFLPGLALPLALAACGGEVDQLDAEDTAAAAQALIDGGDTLEGAGDDGVAGEDTPDDEAALEEADPAGSCEPGALRARVIARYDADGDGELSDDERQDLRDDVEGHPLLRRAIERHRLVRRAVLHRLRFVYDANDDGRLDETERQTLKDDLIARCEARRAQILERYDVDGSGDLSDAEKDQLKSDLRARLMALRAEVLERFDANGDGRLDLSERQAVREAIQARMATIRAELKARFDVDGDGELSADERNALREFLRQRIRLEVPAGDGTELLP